MSRYRWFVLLGPPLLALAAGSSAVASIAPTVACLSGPQPPHPGSSAWWRERPEVDADGALAGWALEVGTSDSRLPGVSLPPASLVSGPHAGRVIASTDDGRLSTVQIIDAPSGCVEVRAVGSAIARQAVADGAGGVLVHLLDRTTRADLGIWRLTDDGQPMTQVLPPLDAGAQAQAGIERVWTTALRASADGTRLAVQSCDPHACLTRVLDHRTGGVAFLSGEQGDVVGFAGDRLITMAACHGLPCGVLSWAADGSAASTLEPAALAAAVSPDGRVVVAIAEGPGRTSAVVSDRDGGHRRSLGSLGSVGAVQIGTLIGGSGNGLAGIEAGPNAVGLLQASGVPTALGLDSAAPLVPPALEVQP